MKDVFTYRELVGSIEFSLADNCLFGRILGINGAYAYEGNTLSELESDFRHMVDLYYEDQKELFGTKQTAAM